MEDNADGQRIQAVFQIEFSQFIQRFADYFQMSGRADWKEFRNALNDCQNDDFNKYVHVYGGKLGIFQVFERICSDYRST